MVLIKENCRLCQKNAGIITINNNLTHLIHKITKLKLNIDSIGILPTHICLKCNNKLLDISLFISEVEEVDKNLNNYLNKSSVNIIENNDIFMCSICNKTFNESSDLVIHQELHTQSNCLYCKVMFNDVTELCEHKCGKDDTVDDTPIDFEFNNQYVCDQENCLKVYTTAYSLKMHKLTHEGKRTFLCVICGKNFLSKKSLVCHEKIHSAIKAYKCDACNINFSVRSNLRAHIRRYHEGVRYHCSQCPREFLTKCNLDRHEKIHTGIKEFKCDTCTSAFYTKKELIKHQRYHQGLKQFKCEECFKMFFERHHLIVHLRSHSGERPFVCDYLECGKSFYDNQKLKRHKKTVHINK